MERGPAGLALEASLRLGGTVLAVSWIVQPISYFPALGVAGTYMTWLAGSAGDILRPLLRCGTAGCGR